MQADPFRGNLQLTINILRWLDRGHRARRIVLLHGDVAMYGDPRSFIDDPRGGKVGRSIGELNFWLSTRRDWLLTPAAMKGLAAALAALLLVLAMIALPVRRGPRIDGAWLRFGRPARRDEPYGLVLAADRGAGLGRGSSPGRGAQEARRAPASLLVLACILRDQVQSVLAEVLTEAARAAEPATASVAGAASSRPVTSPTEPLYTLPEAELVARVSAAKGTSAAVALARVYRRLRALPSRGQAAAPWSSGHLARRDFDALYRDVAALCRTLGAALTEAPASEEAV